METCVSIEATTDTSTATLINAYVSKGRTFVHYARHISLSPEEILNGIAKAFRGTLTPQKDGPAGGELGGLSIQALAKQKKEDEEYVYIDMAVVADASTHARINAFMDDNAYVNKKREGVFDIFVNHWYLDKKEDIKCIHHHMDTEDFDDLRPEVYPRINVDLMMKLYSDSDECTLILTGEPGTGKTCFTKMTMAAYARHFKSDIDCVYVKDRNLLAKDEFWAIMADNKPDMIILDDLDDELVPRTEGRNPIINNLLSYSDGVFKIDTKIIITTNQPNSRIDKALIRPGRCFDILSLPQLSREEAELVWIETLQAPPEEYANRFGEARSVSQAAVMSEHMRWKKSSAGSYLLDPSISIRTLVEEGHAANE